MTKFHALISKKCPSFALYISTLLAFSNAFAEPVNVQTTLAPKEQIKLDFKDGSGHFVLMVRREGNASGSGLFDGAKVIEFGRHDIVPGISGDPSGYLVISKGEENTAYLKWTVRAVFLPGKDGKPELNDNGFWEVVSGTGNFKGLRGAGTLHIKPAGQTDRTFILDGQLIVAKP